MTRIEIIVMVIFGKDKKDDLEFVLFAQKYFIQIERMSQGSE